MLCGDDAFGFFFSFLKSCNQAADCNINVVTPKLMIPYFPLPFCYLVAVNHVFSMQLD